MPWRRTTSWRASARFVFGSFFSRHRASMPRLASRCVRMSIICLSWNSASALSSTVNSLAFSSNVAPVSLKSKRCVSSRFAWSTALVSSCVSSSETVSNDGMSGLERLLEFRHEVGTHLRAQELEDDGHELLRVLGGEPEFAEAADDVRDERGVAAD